MNYAEIFESRIQSVIMIRLIQIEKLKFYFKFALYATLFPRHIKSNLNI